VLAARTLLTQRHFALLVCVAALLLKLLVPAGYMIDSDRSLLSMTVCSGAAPRTTAMTMHTMPGDMPGHGKSEDHGKTPMPCSFASLANAALPTIDPVQLAALIAFIMVIGLAGFRAARPWAPPYLRPPLRGPPATP